MARTPYASRKPRRLGLLPLQFLRRLIVLALVFALLPSGLPAQQLDPSIKEKQAAAIKAIADVMAGGSDRAGQLIKDYGYQPASEAIWDSLPVVRQLEAAYLTFESKMPSRGGEQFLALLSSDLARRYQAVRYEPTLQIYATTPRPSPLPPTGPVPLPPLSERPPERVAAAIETIAQYCEGSALGGAHGVLTTHFGLSGRDAYEVLRSTENNAEALARGLDRVAPEARHQAMTNVVSDIDFVYGRSARAQTALNPFRPQRSREAALLPSIYSDGRGGPPNPPDTPNPPPTTPPTPGRPGGPPPNRVGPSDPGGSGGGGGPSIPAPDLPRTPRPAPGEVARHYSEFLQSNHGTAARRSFPRMTRTARGFGGVVFGSPVEADAALSGLKSIDWVPATQRQGGDAPETPTGRLVFRFVSGNGAKSSLVYGPVLQEEVYAAEQMVYGKFGDVPVWEPGQGIGLVGIDEPIPYFDCGEDELVNVGSRWRVVVHPALADSRIGWAALMVDVMLIGRGQLDRLVEGNAGEDELEAFRDWIETTEGDWKYTDVPTRVTAQGGRLIVERKQDRHAYPEHLRRTAFIDLLGEGGGDITPFSTKFYPLVPLIARSSQDYSRLNRFAAVLALMRWAKSANAAVTTKAERAAEVLTPGSIIITGDGFIAAPDYKLETAGAELRAKIDRRLAQISERFPEEARASLERIRRSWSDIVEQGEAVGLRRRRSAEAHLKFADEFEDAIESAPPDVRDKFKKLKDDVIKADEELELAYGGGNQTQAREALDAARTRLSDFMAATLPSVAQRERTLKQEDEEIRRAVASQLLGFTAKLNSISEEERRVAEALLPTAAEQTRAEYQSVAADLATVEQQSKSDREAVERLAVRKEELSSNFRSRLATAAPEVRQRYAALVAELDELEDAPLGTSEEEARLEARAADVERKLAETRAAVYPEYNQEFDRIVRERAQLDRKLDDQYSRKGELTLRKQSLLKQLSPELSRWHFFIAAYSRTLFL